MALGPSWIGGAPRCLNWFLVAARRNRLHSLSNRGGLGGGVMTLMTLWLPMVPHARKIMLWTRTTARQLVGV